MRSKPTRFKRGGLHKLGCDCGSYVYATAASLEAHGLPVCPCGRNYQPDRVELADLLGVSDCPAVDEYQREVEKVMRGQHGHVKRGSWNLRSPDEIALERVEKRRRDLARSNRLGAIAPVAEPMPF